MPASKGNLGLLLVLVCGLTQAADKDDAVYASYACQQYAVASLKTLGKPKADATRPATPASVNDKRWAGTAEVWLASGVVQAQASFGAPMVRSEYQCAVQKTPGAGWKLLDLQWPQGRP